MHLPTPLLLISLLLAPALSTPLPSHAPPPDARSPAGHPRASQPVTWRDPLSSTWIRLTFQGGRPPRVAALALPLLQGTYAGIVAHVREEGDGFVPSGYFRVEKSGVELYTVNSNNHQQTWGVLAAALHTLADWMSSTGNMGAAHFVIFDGQNEVGQGTVGLVT